MPHALEHSVLAEAMQQHFFHRDQAAQFQNRFRSEQQRFIRELASQALPTDRIRTAAIEFEKASQEHALFKQAMQLSEEAREDARAWYQRHAGVDTETVLTGTDPAPNGELSLVSTAESDVLWDQESRKV